MNMTLDSTRVPSGRSKSRRCSGGGPNVKAPQPFGTTDSQSRMVVDFNCGSVPRVTAGDLAPLHIIEDRLRDLAAERRERARRRGPVPAFVIGQAVRLPGAFEGLDLIVMAIDGATVHLSRPGWTLPPVVISAWNLEAALPRAA